MRKIHVIQHTHWDFEWYFTRQQARVQFAYHMQEVLHALEQNQIDYYLLDGQMAIVDDYLVNHTDQRDRIARLVKAGRLFVGPWYTQIDEMVTSGEAIVRNLQLGHQLANELGAVMKVGYLPDSFGQGCDMPKIYRGFDIYDAVFWRGLPAEKEARYFYWTSDDESTVLVANIADGYYAGVELIETDNVTHVLTKAFQKSKSRDVVLPLGGDQRPVDKNIKARLKWANAVQNEAQFVEDNYPHFFQTLRENAPFVTYQGEWIDPSVSKIHRGIYSSRADLKALYDRLENLMTRQVEPLMALAKLQGIQPETGLVQDIWKAIARGQAHDSSGGCNSDVTNQDIKQRGVVALQLAESVRDYLLRKLASASAADVVVWNPMLTSQCQHYTLKLSTPYQNFCLETLTGEAIPFDVLSQQQVDAATRRRDKTKEVSDIFYQTEVVFPLAIPSFDWQGLLIKPLPDEASLSPLKRQMTTHKDEEPVLIQNDYCTVQFKAGQLDFRSADGNIILKNFLYFNDGGDEGDNYDYSPPFMDHQLTLTLAAAQGTVRVGEYFQELSLKGQWRLPSDLSHRMYSECDTTCDYTLTLTLYADDPLLHFDLTLNNQAKDHRLRLILDTPIQATMSYTDTPFGYIERPIGDPHLYDWQLIGYREEPTALRPFLHFANTHDRQCSVSVIGYGEKECEIIGESAQQLAITLFRSVGELGRPDLTRRPGDASGLTMRQVFTPDSQLLGDDHHYQGGILVSDCFDPVQLQQAHQRLVTGSLYYQNQTVDRFTTPLTYFPIQPLVKPLHHSGDLRLESDDLVMSALTLTPDETGIVVRVYNPAKQSVSQAGRLIFQREANVKQLNLNHDVQQTLADGVTQYALNDFRPGEIRTYGIYLATVE
ncbi:MAG: glycoside hydrolase family 38 C-terminal domain-containing protein [Aerococcus sp.]|nr:glycoside hydrolase family 38 C-terminal domain-containing protein [Aerococcus sp.]